MSGVRPSGKIALRLDLRRYVDLLALTDKRRSRDSHFASAGVNSAKYRNNRHDSKTVIALCANLSHG